MQEPASAFAALGLQPGADRLAIEQAYRRLIKQHHPDRTGGDVARAAEINRAYRELRDHSAAPENPLEPVRRARRSHSHTAHRKRVRRRGRGRLWPPVAIAAVALLVIEGQAILEAAPALVNGLSAELKPVGSGRQIGIDGSMERPLTKQAIGDAVIEAERLAERGQWSELAQRSRECHRQLRAEPQMATLDRCAALDDAAVVLDEREGARERGPFSASAVTTRHMTAASLLSSDYLAIGERLDRIRTAVDLLLVEASPLPSANFATPKAPDQSFEVAATDAVEAAPAAPAADEAGAD